MNNQHDCLNSGNINKCTILQSMYNSTIYVQFYNPCTILQSMYNSAIYVIFLSLSPDMFRHCRHLQGVFIKISLKVTAINSLQKQTFCDVNIASFGSNYMCVCVCVCVCVYIYIYIHKI
jgi:hypothetical protein